MIGKKNFAFIEVLNSEQKAKLKGLAHHLKPIIQIGNQGFSDSVKKEIILALDKHELIKVQIPAESKDENQAILLTLLPLYLL